jgi:hypothetical protein
VSLERPAGRPVTGDPVVDAALRELDGVDEQDLDAVLSTGERLERDLGARLDGVAVE